MRLHLAPATRTASHAAVAVLLASALADPAGAQGITARVLCTNHGPNLIEPLVGREGQSLLAAEATCAVQGGPMDASVETQHILWHYDKASGQLLSGHAVARKPGALGASTITQGALSFQMADGKVTGWTASGKGRQTLAAGAASALAGKSFAWTASPTGPRSYVILVAYEP